jgi:hypothetical protein
MIRAMHGVGLREMPQDDDRHLGQTEWACRQQSGVAVIRSHQNRIGPPPLPNRGSDLGDLLGTMRAPIGAPRDQPLDRPWFHLDVDLDRVASPWLGWRLVLRGHPRSAGRRGFAVLTESSYASTFDMSNERAGQDRACAPVRTRANQGRPTLSRRL